MSTLEDRQTHAYSARAALIAHCLLVQMSRHKKPANVIDIQAGVHEALGKQLLATPVSGTTDFLAQQFKVGRHASALSWSTGIVDTNTAI